MSEPNDILDQDPVEPIDPPGQPTGLTPPPFSDEAAPVDGTGDLPADPDADPAEEPTDEEPADDPAPEPAPSDVPTRAEVDDLARRLRELEEALTAPVDAPPAPAGERSLVGRVVEFDGHDQWGNPRRLVGVVLGPHLIQEDRLDVSVLPSDLNHAYDAADLRPLGS